jgi:hypothetical protein
MVIRRGVDSPAANSRTANPAGTVSRAATSSGGGTGTGTGDIPLAGVDLGVAVGVAVVDNVVWVCGGIVTVRVAVDVSFSLTRGKKRVVPWREKSITMIPTRIISATMSVSRLGCIALPRLDS